MKSKVTASYPLDASLAPENALPPIVRKADIIQWAANLKSVLKAWMSDNQSPFRAVVDEFGSTLRHDSVLDLEMASDPKSNVDLEDLRETTLPLLTTLNGQNALPAILFSFDRDQCEIICQALLTQLTDAEEAWKACSPEWRSKLDKYDKWLKSQRAKPKKTANSQKGKRIDDAGDAASKTESGREAAETEQSPFASFDPNGIVDGFSFANNKMLLPSEFAEVQDKLEWKRIAPWLIHALQRGIGVHHSGMTRAYRHAVEVLMRKGYLTVVLATGTLALGINMPCKTVVFSGSTIYLTALNYRQAAGRAGRRGFDLLGNVVFQNIGHDKVLRLMSSRLPDLHGHFPVTTGLIMNLFMLLHGSNRSEYAVSVIDSLLSQPRLYLGGESFREQVLHHLRYSIEYLRRQHLLGVDGAPINFAPAVSRMLHTESPAFGWHYLLKQGYFHQLCAGFVTGGQSEARILDTLMLVMAHLFERLPAKRMDPHSIDRAVSKHGSLVVLPALPAEAEELLHAHNAETLSIFRTYVKTFTEQHAGKLGPDNVLPLTKMRIGGDNDTVTELEALRSLPPVQIRSAFVALSGHGDDFESISELCQTVRSGVWLEEAVVPHIPVGSEESMPINACK